MAVEENRTTRLFNADVGDSSVGVAGPDAIENDLDNLYQNKAWNKNVLTKNNNIPFIPTENYHPATKKYVDDVAKVRNANVFVENNNINIVQTDIITADTAQLLNAWIKNLIVEVVNTNFEDYVTGTRIDNGEQIGNNSTSRDYIKVEGEEMSCIAQELSMAQRVFKLVGKDGIEIPIYYTSVRGAYAYKFYTIQNPCALAGTWQKNMYYKPYMIIKGTDDKYYYVKPSYNVNGYTKFDSAIHQLIETSAEEHMVKVKTVKNELVKFKIGFELNDDGKTKEVKMQLGVGEGETELGGKARIYKGKDGLKIEYFKQYTQDRVAVELGENGLSIGGFNMLTSLEVGDFYFTATYGDKQKKYITKKDSKGRITSIEVDGMTIPVTYKGVL